MIGDSIFSFLGMYINGVLVKNIGIIGVQLYVTSIKLQDLLVTPITAYGRAMLSGFGMSHHVLVFTIIAILLEQFLISVLDDFLPMGSSVLVGIFIGQIIISIAYYIYMQWMFNRFENKLEKDELNVI